MRRMLCFLTCLSLLLFCSTALAKKKGLAKLDVETCEKSKIEIDDGDTFKCNGLTIRLIGADTPEIAHPRHGISADQEKGREAAAFAKSAIEGAKRVIVAKAGKDRYGRTLAHALIDGELLSVKLIKASLAYETITRYGTNGMPEFALAILETAKSSPAPSFEDPHEWRKKNQLK